MSRILSLLIMTAGVMALIALRAAPLLAFSEETLPAEDASPSAGASAAPGASPAAAGDNSSGAGGEWERVPNPDTASVPDGAMPPAASNTVGGAGNVNPPMAQPADNSPPPALDVSTMTTEADPSQAPLTSAIKTAAANPAMAASLRQTEQARRELAEGKFDEALRSLGRAVSIDPGNPFAYFYLGRVYAERNNYQQALTFFKRAEIGFGPLPEWLGETLGNEGECYEEMGQMSDAAKAYHDALGSAPNNLTARAGFGRVGDQYPATTAANSAIPPEDASTSSSGSEVAPPPEEPAPPPPPDGPAPVEELPAGAKAAPDSP
ncbi:MAG: tetratricopeptide repeat protein [Candidatus Binataceae bacterium]|jgi:TolA-binding protein